MPPAWRERSGPGSFRGVPFQVRGVELTGGRKTVRHEYPLKDTAFVEDLGRKARGLRVTAYVVGSDYIAQRDRLRDECEKGGPGPLVLPYEENRLVMVGDFTISFIDTDAGMAGFSIDFEETDPKPANPTTVTSPSSKLGLTSDGLLETNQNSFSKRFNLTVQQATSTGVTRTKPLPGWSLASAASLVSDASAALRTSLAPIVGTNEQLSSLKRQTDALISNATSLIRTPTSLAAQFTNLLRDLTTWPITPALGFKALMHAFNFIPSTPRPTPSTSTRAVENTNYTAVDTFIRVAIIDRAGPFAGDASLPGTGLPIPLSPRTITGGPATRFPDGSRTGGFETYEQATSAREQLTAAIDTLLPTVDDVVYAALVQLRADVIAAVPGEQSTLPRIVTFTPPGTLPSLVVSYRLYGDLALADDIVDRNRIAHPGFVRGGRALQVLSHA